MKKLIAVALALVLALSMAAAVSAAGAPQLTYELLLTDQTGMPVSNPRSLGEGDTLNVEIVLSRTDLSSAYDMFGVEFRLSTQGLQYNGDGSSLRGGTAVRENQYSDGLSVGFAWYDMQQVGESTNNPVLAGSWSYTVTDASAINIRVPVALVYLTGYTEDFIPTGAARLFLEPNGGEIEGEDLSGDYTSGTVLKLPEVKRAGWVFSGWSDGVNLYPAGSEYVVSGIVTLTAQWEEPVRNRHLTLDPKGGEIVGEDISGYYADGEIVILPDAELEGYVLAGWNDGAETYAANAEYEVYNSVTLVAQWETPAVGGETETPPPSEEPTQPGPDADTPDAPDKAGLKLPTGVLIGVPAGIIVLLLIILLIWKRGFVLYSLKSGEVALNYKNDERAVSVEVILIEGENEHSLRKSGIIRKGRRLRLIKNAAGLPIAAVEAGKYKGKLLITAEGFEETKDCRIKVIDKELKK